MKGETAPGEATAREWVEGALRAVFAPAQAANYTFFLAPGSQHCILPRPELYTLRVGRWPSWTGLGPWRRGRPRPGCAPEAKGGEPIPKLGVKGKEQAVALLAVQGSRFQKGLQEAVPVLLQKRLGLQGELGLEPQGAFQAPRRLS